jgi:hypothetical protein
MELKRFEELIKKTRLYSGRGRPRGSRTLIALRYHLVDGKPISEAVRLAGKPALTRSAVYKALKTLPRETCKHCGQFLPQDQAAK